MLLIRNACANIQGLHLAVKSDVKAKYETPDFTNPVKICEIYISQDKTKNIVHANTEPSA